MADKNLHDIKIDDIDGSKKTPLKNILTLLALLFIILVISVVITKLILNTDEGKEIEGNLSTSELAINDLNASGTADAATHALSTATSDAKNGVSTAAVAATAAAAAVVPVISNAITDRNLTSVTKDPLRTHTATKDVKEIKELKEVKKVKEAAKPKTYKTPKHSSSPKKSSTTKHNSTPKKHLTNRSNSSKKSTPKKSYKDKVISKKSSSHTTKKSYTHKSTSHKNTTKKVTTHKANYLGGKLKAVTNSYYVKVGTYRNYSAVLSKIKKINFNYSLVKLKDDKTMTRVYIGPFFSRNEAKKHMSKIKSKVMQGAYITKAK